MLFAGSGGPKDEEEARRLLGPLAAQGVADAQCGLARMFYEGRGGPKDEV
jgi:TPR repeat protein